MHCLRKLIRERLIQSRTGLCNQTRGLLAEDGIVTKKGEKGFLLTTQTCLNNDNLSEILKTGLHNALYEPQQTSDHFAKIEARFLAFVEQEEDCQIPHSMPCIGVINTSALVCKYGNGSHFSKSESLPLTSASHQS